MKVWSSRLLKQSLRYLQLGAVDVTIRMLVTSLAISNFGTEQQLSIRVQESKHFDGLKMAAGRVAS